MFQPSKLDLTKTKTFSAANRHNLVRIDTLRTPGQQEDDLFDSPEFRILLQKLDAAQKAGKTITCFIGAHVIKCGLSRYLIWMMEHGYITHLRNIILFLLLVFFIFYNLLSFYFFFPLGIIPLKAPPNLFADIPSPIPFNDTADTAIRDFTIFSVLDKDIKNITPTNGALTAILLAIYINTIYTKQWIG